MKCIACADDFFLILTFYFWLPRYLVSFYTTHFIPTYASASYSIGTGAFHLVLSTKEGRVCCSDSSRFGRVRIIFSRGRFKLIHVISRNTDSETDYRSKIGTLHKGNGHFPSKIITIIMFRIML